MQLQDVLGSRCLIGLSYFNRQGQLIKQSQLAGKVVTVSEEDGISVQLQHSAALADSSDGKLPVFILPPSLSCWFRAPGGHYRNPETQVDIHDPDYLVTWDIYQTRQDTPEGEHEWWEWVPRTSPPAVGQSAPG